MMNMFASVIKIVFDNFKKHFYESVAPGNLSSDHDWRGGNSRFSRFSENFFHDIFLVTEFIKVLS